MIINKIGVLQVHCGFYEVATDLGGDWSEFGSDLGGVWIKFGGFVGVLVVVRIFSGGGWLVGWFGGWWW